MPKKEKPQLNSIKTGRLSRGFALAKMTLSATTEAGKFAVGSYFSDDAGKSERSKALLMSQMNLLTETFGQLKGTLMKVGQMLSIYGEQILPAEVNAVLKTLQNNSPPLAWPAIEKVIKSRLSTDQLSKLEIEKTAIASASLGQVHLATRKSDGLKIALKIQYPGVDRAIETDIKAMRSLLNVSKLIPGGPKYDALFAEVKAMLEREVDYTQELSATESMRRRLQGDARYIVPTPLKEFSGPHILATSFEEGFPADSPEVAALSQARRNAIGAALYDLFLKEIFEFKMVQTDAHFGNYRIRLAQSPNESDALVLLDFGAMRAVSSDFLKRYRKLVTAVLDNHAPAFFEAALELEILETEDSDAARARLYDLCKLILEPALLDQKIAYDWGSSDIATRAFAQGRQLAFDFKLRPPPQEAVFLNRKTAGIFVFMKVLKVQLNPRALLDQYLKSS